MAKIDKVSWGKVKIDGQKYHQVLIIGDRVIERDGDKLRELFGTTHRIGDWEQKLLMSKNPDVVLIANGWSGVLKVEEEFKKRLKANGIEMKTILTPKVIKGYEALVQKGKRVNVLIHTTC